MHIYTYIHREKELAKVTIKKEDLELIVSSNAWMDAQEKFYLIWVPNKWSQGLVDTFMPERRHR